MPSFSFGRRTASEFSTKLTPRVKTATRLACQGALLGSIVFAVLGLRPGQVSGVSMEPRIGPDEYVVINALAYRWGAPQRGEIAAFRHERSAPTVYLKRVIGLPSDHVAVREGVVLLNGLPLYEPYVRFRDTRSFPSVIVPPSAYYVLGDNRANSDDSRAWGFVPARDVIGRAMFAVWPLQRFGVLQ